MRGLLARLAGTMQASAILAIAATATAKCAALRHIGRRSAIGLAGSAAVAAVVPDAANAAADPTVKIYFGAGCFWHVQHEFVGEEVAALQRGPESITARTGYAGGTLGGGLKDGKVCYHNFKGVADYGSLGHAEAVQLEVPTSAVPRFAKKRAHGAVCRAGPWPAPPDAALSRLGTLTSSVAAATGTTPRTAAESTARCRHRAVPT